MFGGHAMGKDSAMRNMGLLNQLWDGQSLTINRRTSESFAVRGARLTMALQVQPETLRAFFEKSGPLARGIGFLARFLLSQPVSTQGYRPFTEAPETWPRLATFHRRLAAILDTPAPIDDDGGLSPQLLAFDPNAKAAWVEYHDTVEGKLRAGGELCDVRDVASKSADNAARLAALFHLFESGIGPIGADTIGRACRIAAWHLHEARRFFGEIAQPPEMADAARLDDWLTRYCRNQDTLTVSTRETQQLGPVRDRDRLDRALALLEELDRVQVIESGKRKVVKINVELLEQRQ